HHDAILDPLRKLGQLALPVSQAKLVFEHQVADLQAATLKAGDGKVGMGRKPRRQRRTFEVKPLSRSDHLTGSPLQVRQHRALESPCVRRVEWIRLANAGSLQGAAHRLEERLAVFLDQRLEERHAEDLTLSLINARGEVFVNVLSKEMPTEECPAT